MTNKVSKTLISLVAIASSTTLGLGFATSAQAATHGVRYVPPKALTAPVAVNQAPVAVSMQQLAAKVAAVPQLAGLKDGAVVILNDNGQVTNQIWQGTYIYHPAGSKITPSAMYARWKDGIVAITPTPALSNGTLPGTFDASFVKQNGSTAFQSIETLTRDSADMSVLRIPSNAWLFRVDGNGQYTALVDVFTFQSGNQPVLNQPSSSGTLPAANGSQPVPVSAGFVQTDG